MVVQYNHFGEVIPLMSVFKYICFFRGRFDAWCFVLGVRICSADFYVRGGHVLRLTAVRIWANRWLHCSGRDAA